MSEPLADAGEPRASEIPHAPISEKPKFCYEYPQASPCGALILYTLDGDKLDVLTTQRAECVGTGRSVAAGGFWEVKHALAVPDITIDGSEELYREFHEELGEEIKTIIPYEQFLQRVEPIWDGMRHIGNGLGVHAITQKSMRVSVSEMAAICALPDTAEQVGKKIESFLLGAFNNAAEAATHIRERLHDFRYPVEVEGVVKLYDRLERAQQPAFVPAGGWN